MDLSKIKTLIDFVGRTDVTELAVSEKDVTLRIFRTAKNVVAAVADERLQGDAAENGSADTPQVLTAPVKAPVFGILHRASAPGQAPFVQVGDIVEEGQTLFIIEAMKVFNKIAAPKSGRVSYLTDVDGGEIETGDLLAEIA